MTYTRTEKEYILKEFQSLQLARNETIKDEVLKEWVKLFGEAGYSAEHICRMIKVVKLANISYKLKYADFTDRIDETRGLQQIIPLDPATLITGKTDEEAKIAEEKDVAATNNLIYNVRNVLGISWIAFIIEAEEKGYSYRSYYELLKDNSTETQCLKLDSKKGQRTLIESIKEI